MSLLAPLLPVLALTAVAAALGTALLALAAGGGKRGGVGGSGAAGPGVDGSGVGGSGMGGPGVGTAPARPGGDDRTGTAATALVAGLVLLYLLLLALDAAGVPWRRVTVAGASLAAFVLLAGAAAVRLLAGGGGAAAAFRRLLGGAPWLRRLAGRRGGGAPGGAPRPGWGDLLAAGTLGIVGWGAWHRSIAIPDFVYHWGIKGKRFHLAGGVDLAFLADPLEPVQHPDYPFFLPSLYAATAHVRGFFDERSMLLWTVVFLALLVAFARSALARGGAGGAWLQGGVALVALVAAFFGVGYDLAGGGDPLLALALVAALPALVPQRPAAGAGGTGADPARLHRDDLRLGVAAALAAAAKVEGVPLAGFLLLARLLVTVPLPGRTAAVGRELGSLLRRLPRLALPPLAVMVPWMVAALRFGLFGGRETGVPELARLAEVVPAALRVFAAPEWHLFPWLLLLLPWLLASRRLRAGAAVVAAQGAFYLLVYLATPVDTTFYVLSSLPRLLFHLLPAFLVLLVLRLAAEGRPAPSAADRPRPPAS